MDKFEKLLCEWTKKYVEHRDLFTKSIKNIEMDGQIIKITHKDKEQIYFIEPFFENGGKAFLFLAKNPTKRISIVCFNVESNLNILISKWKELIQYKFLNLFFVNPFSELDKRWIIYPHTHNRISDPESLNLGLKAMFEGVTPTSKQELEDIVIFS